MPRSRSQLTDKQERILVQCQLMGLTTADMITISNRLKSIDREKEFRERVDEVSRDFTFVEKNQKEFTITDLQGKIYEFRVYTIRTNEDWYNRTTTYADVKISKPGTRFKQKNLKKIKLSLLANEIVSQCPNGNKYLYRAMREIVMGRIN